MRVLSIFDRWLNRARSCPPNFPPNPFQLLSLGNGETIRCKIAQVIWGREIAANGSLTEEIAYYFAITPGGKYFRLTADQLDSMTSDGDETKDAA